MSEALLAVDWGLTHLRAWVLDEAGSILRSHRADRGVGSLAPGTAAEIFAREVQQPLAAQALPALLCGMIGSNLGWASAPYVDCPARLGDLARGLLPVAPLVWIVPGLADRSRPPGDIMRGEETQIFGWIAGEPSRLDGRHTLIHPGTHSKWVRVEEGRLVRFATSMTGELFALLSRHGVLATESVAAEDEGFAAGLAAGGAGDALAARLFSARVRRILGGASVQSEASYLSGLLIGAEIAAMPGFFGLSTSEPVHLLGAPALCRLYEAGFRARGVTVSSHDGETAVLRGLHVLARAPERLALWGKKRCPGSI